MTKAIIKNLFCLGFIYVISLQVSLSQEFSLVDDASIVDDTLKINSIVDSLSLKQRHFMSVDKDSAIYYTNEALKLAKKVNYKKAIISLYTNLGIVYMEQSEIDKSLEISEIVLEESLQYGNPLLISQAYNNIGACYIKKNDYYKTLFYYEKGIDVLVESEENYDEQLGLLLSNIGIVYASISDYDAALIKLEEAHDFFTRVGKPLRILNSYNLQGNVNFDKDDKEKALEFYNKALTIAQQEKTESYIIYTYINLIFYHLNQPNFKEINSILEKIESVNKNYQNDGKINAELNYARAVLMYEKGDLDKSQMLALKALQNIGKTQIKTSIKISKLLLDISIKKGNNKELPTYSDLYIKLKDSLNSLDSDASFYKGQVNFEINKLKLEQAKEREVAKEQSLQQVKRYNKMIVIASILIILFMALAWFKNKKLAISKSNEIKFFQEKIKLEKQIENIETSIASDLHDNFGNRISGVITAHEIVKDIVKSNKEIDLNYKKFTGLLEKNLLPLSNDIKDLLWANNKVNNNLDAIVDRLRNIFIDFSKDDVEINLTYNSQTPYLELPKLANKQILFIVKEAVNNALKYSKSDVIDVLIEVTKDKKLKIEIKDYGVGFNINQLDHKNGLNNMGKRAKSIDLDYHIESDHNGTRISMESTSDILI